MNGIPNHSRCPLNTHANALMMCRASVNALSMTFFGRMHHLPEVSHQGDLLYSKAILQLAGKLNGGDEAFSTHVLMATLTLTIHEVFYRPST